MCLRYSSDIQFCHLYVFHYIYIFKYFKVLYIVKSTGFLFVYLALISNIFINMYYSFLPQLNELKIK